MHQVLYLLNYVMERLWLNMKASIRDVCFPDCSIIIIPQARALCAWESLSLALLAPPPL